MSYAAIDELLIRLGFTCKEQEVQRAIQPPEPKTHLIYSHADSGTTLWLPGKDAQPALAADLMSVRTHLVQRGLIEEDEFATFVKEHALADQAT